MLIVIDWSFTAGHDRLDISIQQFLVLARIAMELRSLMLEWIKGI